MRLVMGNNYPSYIEVQKSWKELEKIYSIDSTGSVRAVVINGRGDVFFSRFDEGETHSLIKYLENTQNILKINRVGKNIAAVSYSPYTDTYTVLIQSRESIRAFNYIILMTVIICLLVCLVSVFFIYALSNRIAAPVRRLITRMEHTNLENIDRINHTDTEAEDSDDELVKLYQSYDRLLKRLNSAIHQEKEMGFLHLQAEFDTLQAQVNPHFIYNVLNVISHRGVINRDEAVCAICEKLASMLRYSTGISRRLVTIRDELEYVQNYFYLLKTRYRDKLEYEIKIDPPVMEQPLPKIVLQPLIENAINHGYRDAVDTMRIGIRGWSANGCWYIEIKDYGSGFTGDKKKFLEQKMDDIRIQIKKENWNFDMEIGGMGLLNIYARFLILFGEGVVFSIANHREGALVIIGAVMDGGPPGREGSALHSIGM
jgi:two-component system sensor histidine kinase YesM